MKTNKGYAITSIQTTPRITIVIYSGHLPVAVGHLDPEGGKTWLGVSVVSGNTPSADEQRWIKYIIESNDT